MSLIIDTDSADTIMYLKDQSFSKYNTVNLYSINIKLSDVNHRTEFICYIHCSVVDTDDNILNDKKSDVIGVILINIFNAKRYLYHKFPNIGRSINSRDFTTIRMTLRDKHGTILDNKIEHVVYELGFTSK